MARAKHGIIATVLLITLLVSGSCSKTPVADGTFTEVCGDYGYTVSEDADTLNAVTAYGFDTALKAAKEDDSISYMVFSSADEANAYFDAMDEAYGNQGGGFFSFIQKNSEEFTFRDNPAKFRTVRIDNVVITVSADDTEERNKEIEKMLGQMGY